MRRSRTTPITSTPASSECFCASTVPSALACGWCSITWSASNRIANGDIAALQTRSQGPLAGDLFVDCTGLQSLLLGRHYQTPFVSQKHVLFNDSALALQVPYPDDDSPIASQTLSTAQSSGWIWDIGLPTRRGIGHVYSSAHISDDAGRGRAAPLRGAGGRSEQQRGHAAQAHVRAGLSRSTSGTATASPSDCRLASSSRSKPRRWRWSSCPPPCSATRCRRRARQWTSSRGASTIRSPIDGNASSIF